MTTSLLIARREVYAYLGEFCEREGLHLFPQVIKQSVRFAEAPGYRTPLALWRKELDGAKQYHSLALEVMKNGKA